MKELLEKVAKMYEEAAKAAMDTAKSSDQYRELSLKNEGASFAYKNVADLVAQEIARAEKKETAGRCSEPDEEAEDEPANPS